MIKGLKALTNLRSFKNMSLNEIKYFETIEKELLVLNAIIDKKVDVDYLLGVLQYDDGLEVYNNSIKSENRQLTQKEYNRIMEMFSKCVKD